MELILCSILLINSLILATCECSFHKWVSFSLVILKCLRFFTAVIPLESKEIYIENNIVSDLMHKFLLSFFSVIASWTDKICAMLGILE